MGGAGTGMAPTDGAHEVRLGVLLGSELPPEEVVAAARAAEQFGVDDLWVTEDYFFGAAFSTAAAILGATQRVRVGIGVVSAMVRHPAVTAMEIATIARLHPGRILPALGYGAPGWVAQMGLSHPRPVAAVRERLRAVRGLLRGEEVTVAGTDFSLDAVRLTHPPRQVPSVLLGVSGPKMLKMAATEANGTVLSLLSGPRYIEWVREVQAVTGPPPALTCFALTAVDQGSGRARDAARAAVAAMVCRRPNSAMIVRSASHETVTTMVGRGREHMAAALPDSCLDEFAIAGTVADGVEGIRVRLAAGATSIVLCPVPGADTGAPMDGIGELLTAAAVSRVPR